MVLGGSLFIFALTGELLTLTWQVLALLGIAGLGSVSARFVSGAPTPASKTSATVANDNNFARLFVTDGSLDVFKLQMFIFTVGAALFVYGRVLIDHAFPELDENLLLLGISNGIYVGSKVAPGESVYRAAERLDIDLKVLNEAKANVDEELKQLDAQIEKAPDADKKLLERRKELLTAKSTEMATKITEATKAREAAIAKL